MLAEVGQGRPPKSAQTFLQRSLRTKDLHQAKVQAKPVLIEFDRILARAEARVADIPIRNTLSPSEIERMADYLYASMLASDDDFRQQAPEIEREQRRYARRRRGG